MAPFLVQDAPQDQVSRLEYPAPHGTLVIAFERLVVPCVPDCSLPSSLLDEVDVVAPSLFLQQFIKSLDSWGAQEYFWWEACFGPIYQEERGFPGCSAGCGPVPP